MSSSGLSLPTAAVLADVFALRAAGASFHAIAAMLNKRELKSPRGSRWYAATVRLIVAGPVAASAHRCTARCRQRERACPVQQ